ncbi:MAG: beta-hydroxyacyl-ACP dehydratase [Phycisphaerales bacterium]|nr:beta-hydroxyacyl-ACP dehydratase [Phycisphaerales bacterium]
MRWIWIDKFTQFESGRRAVAVKNVTRAEEHLHDHFPAWPVMPPSLIIEGVAQTAGILVGEARAFGMNVILAKIRSATFTDYAVPGDTLSYEVEIETLDDHGATTRGVVRRGQEEIARVDLMFSHVDGAVHAGLPRHNFVFTGTFTDLVRSFRPAPPGSGGGDS